MKKYINILKNNDGATAIEYCLIVSLIVMVAISALRRVGQSYQVIYDKISERVGNAESME